MKPDGGSITHKRTKYYNMQPWAGIINSFLQHSACIHCHMYIIASYIYVAAFLFVYLYIRT